MNDKRLRLCVIAIVCVFSLSADSQEEQNNFWSFSSLKRMVMERIYGEETPIVSIPATLIGIIELTNAVDPVDVADIFFRASRDSKIVGIELFIDCGGGAAGSFSTLHDTIKKVAESKPVVAFIRGQALSGAYLAASACTYIVSPEGAEIGSIGTVLTIERYSNPKIKDTFEADLDVEVIRHGKFKTIYHPYSEKLSEEEKEYLQNRVQVGGMIFRKNVSDNRGISLENASEWAEGKIFFAAQAYDLGLIDEIGTQFAIEDYFTEYFKEKEMHVTSPFSYVLLT